MSQSPSPTATSGEMLAYDAAWSALTLLIRSGRPFSGEERNCAFLNLGPDGGAFANVSSATALDHIDDGRGFALCDWDFDGDLDLWLSNRTGPRARFLRNDFPQGESPRWIAFQLAGTTSNRDAIGARLELEFPDGTKRIRTLCAGHSHLSQSTKWVHFGLGDQRDLKAITVRWPGGDAERFTGIEPGRRYRLVEGSGRAEPTAPPPVAAGFATSEPAVPPVSDGGRIVLLKPSIVPEITADDLEGRPIPLTATGKPLLVNLWATWCAPCVAEMKAWAEEAKAFAAAGLEIVSLSVDEPTGSVEEDRAKLRAFVDNLGYPFRVGTPTGATLDRLDAAQLSFIGRQRELPVPSSFLFDAHGRLAVIYRGPVAAAQLRRDLEILDAAPDAILAAAVPFAGRWIESPKPTPTVKVAAKLTHQGRLSETVAFVDHALRAAERDPDILSEGEGLELRIMRAAVLYDLKRHADALAAWDGLLEELPDNRQILMEAARTHAALGQPREAVPLLERAIALGPEDVDNLVYLGQLRSETGDTPGAIDAFQRARTVRSTPVLCFELAGALTRLGRLGEAVAAFREALDLQPDWPPAANNLAWILATAGDPDLRDGTEAVRLATIACEATNFSMPSVIATLAAAEAEAGDFDRAVATAERGLAAARRNDDQGSADSLAKQLAGYRKRIPFRDPDLAATKPDRSSR